MSKITMQDVADALSISRVTVWKALNNHPGVSDELREQILEKASEIGYCKRKKLKFERLSDQISNAEKQPTQTTVSVVVARPESSLFWMNIIHQIAKELDKANISLMYTYLPSKINPGYSLPSILANGSTHGIIVLNVYDCEILSMLNNLNIPKVFLDMTPQMPLDCLSGDLFLLEGKNVIGKITERIINAGCGEIGFIGDTEYAITNRDRYEGFLTAMRQNNQPVNPELCFTGSIGIYTYDEEINKFLLGLKKMPRAFICVSDYVAHFVLQFLNDHNYRVPEDIAISGFDKSTEYPGIVGHLTTVEVQTRVLGIRLTNQLLYRIAHPNAPTEITYLNTNIVFGESTNI